MPLVTFRTLNYNPNHDDATGRFSSGGGSKTTQEKLGIKSVETSELASVLEGGKEKYIYDTKSDKYIIVKDVIPTKTFYSGDSPYPSKESTKKNIDKLSSAEKSAITGYTSEYGYGSYNEVNKYLRNPNSKKYSQETIDSANNVTSALNKAKLGTNTYVYRGVSAESFENPKTQKAILDANRMIKNGTNRQDLKFLDTLASLKGATITDKAPTSTSPSGGGFFSNGEVKMTIKTKKSDKAMDITSLSRFGGSSITPAFLGVQQKESEVLYAPNTTFQITDVKVTASGVHLLMETTNSKSSNTALNFNPNHDPSSGRFSSGGGSAGKGKIARKRYEEEFDGGTAGGKDNIQGIYDYVHEAPKVELDEAQSEAVQIYNDVGHSSINSYLRKNVNSEYASQVEFIDEAIGKGSLHRDTIVYRGADLGSEENINEIISKGYFKDNGYSSTSLSKEVASDFIKNPESSALFRIHKRKGSDGLLLRNTNAEITSPEEFEVLLPRQSEFYVAYDGWTTIDGKKIRLIGLE